jgi:hypothetical protein
MEEEPGHDAHGHGARQGDAAALRRRGALKAFAVSILLAAGPASAQLPPVYGFVNARDIGGDEELSLPSAAAQSLGPLVTESTPSSDPELPGVHTAQGAALAMNLGAGFLALAAGSEGEVLGQGLRGLGRGSARIAYLENVLVQSESVPAGTPVVIRLRYGVAFGRACLHDLDPAVLEASNVQECISELELRASLRRNETGEIDSTTHYHYVPVGFDETVTGVFAGPSNFGEASVAAEVGETVRVDLFTDASGHLELALGGETLPTGATAASMVVVFGIEADVPGVEVYSPLLGGVLADFSAVTPANALAHVLSLEVGAPITVPEPALAPAAIAALLALAAQRVSANARA